MKKLSTLLLIAAVAAGIDANSAEVTRIAAGDHTMLLTKDGKIYVSGKNDAGQLGDGHYFDSEISDNHYNATTFKPVEKDGVKFRSVTATLYNSYAIASDGALYAWGQNAYGQLGLVSVGTYSGIYTPTKVDDAKWAVVKGRSTTIVGIHTDGTLWAWGKNLTGQLGIGADSEMKECAMAPEKVSDERWIDCASGYYHSTAVKADGTLWAWGDNSQNQVNSSTTTIFTTPQQVGDDNNRAELSKVDFNPEEGAVAEIATDSAVKVYPTVAEETITVSSDAAISSVSVYNANGQKVGFKMVDGTQTSLNVSHLAAGTYFVATESDAGKSVARFIKK